MEVALPGGGGLLTGGYSESTANLCQAFRMSDYLTPAELQQFGNGSGTVGPGHHTTHRHTHKHKQTRIYIYDNRAGNTGRECHPSQWQIILGDDPPAPRQCDSMFRQLGRPV